MTLAFTSRPSMTSALQVIGVAGVARDMAEGWRCAVNADWPPEIGDTPDYPCGSGVFMRYLLYAFLNDTSIQDEFLNFVMSVPDSNFIYKSAETVSSID
jgi:hypothetical protein